MMQKLPVVANVTGDPLLPIKLHGELAVQLAAILRELANDVERKGITEYRVTRAPEYHIGVDGLGCRTYTLGAGENISFELCWKTHG